ncbi:Uncharacterised protein [Vibrio cholerae]|nr:Uncharacterised protein [Vibrio cholerae]CSB49401.1 Uncharacterised protein [Vibrio cholerae]CSB49688.1 Uncharacterised protein [Vibrio cholerae]CSB68604.1 Uncharacterised protein [Vibrio cholerae]CSC00998.1 Uncharacterised protein [Vibrio cholerae]
MYWASGVAERALRMRAHLFHRLQRLLHVAYIVHRIEDTKYIHAVFHRTLHKSIHYIIGIVAVAKQVLPAQQHLQWRIGHGLFE